VHRKIKGKAKLGEKNGQNEAAPQRSYQDYKRSTGGPQVGERKRETTKNPL